MDNRAWSARLRRARPWVRWAICHLLAVSQGLAATGCTRQFFRKRADTDVAEVLKEKDKYEDWRIEQFHVYPDPRARFADPTNPDRPPMPPDDPAAHDLSPNPQKPGKAGIARVCGEGWLQLLDQWDAENRAAAAAAKASAEGKDPSAAAAQQPAGAAPAEQIPVAPTEVPTTPATAPPADQKPGGAGASASLTTSLSSTPKPGERPPYLLKLEQAVELGLINSREYQDAREDLYMASLPVTLERFAFTAQFFAAEQAFRQWAGMDAPETPHNNWTLNSNAGFSKLFSTGALLLFNFANQTVFNLGGGRELTSQSMLNLDFIQPLLRGGGRAVALEPLTQAERNLLYQIRNFARFRKTFYVAIAGGGGGSITGAEFQPTNVIAANPFSPTGSVTGSSGVVPGVIPPVPVAGNPGLQVSPGSSGNLTLQVALAAPVSGYLTTLLQAAQMKVDEYNITKLEGFLNLARAMEEGGDVSRLQVDQFEQQVLRGRTALLMDQQQYLQSLDQFKLQLGLPTPLHLELEDTPFRPLNQHFQRYEDFFNQYLAATRAPERVRTPDAVPQVRRELRRILTSSPFVQDTRFRTEIDARWGAWEKLSADDLAKRLATDKEERRKLQDQRADLENRGQTLSAADQQRLDLVNYEIDLGELESQLRTYESQPWKNLTGPAQARRQQLEFRYVQNAFILVLAEPRDQRLERLRNSWPDLARLCVNGVELLKADLPDAEAAVVQVAEANRLDLMNVRGEVVDAWRQLAVFANALLGTFNVQYHMDSFTPPGLAQPLAFDASRTRQQLIFNTQLPLVRLSERNRYRASLINYQRARRILQRAEDQVALDVRGELRQLRLQEENYRIQQRQVELGYLTVENSLDTFTATPAVGQQSQDPATRAAALTNQLINAQTSLYNAQFAMTTIWITYLNTRLQLYRDMELMPLDYRGVWIDDVATCQCPDRDPARAARLGSPEFDLSPCLPASQRLGDPQ